MCDVTVSYLVVRIKIEQKYKHNNPATLLHMNDKKKKKNYKFK